MYHLHFHSCSTIQYLRIKLSNRRIGLAFIYCDYRDRDNQDMCSLIGELAKQLLLQVPSVPDEVWPLFQKHTAVSTNKAEEIIHLLQQHCFDRIYVCIDALDECQPNFRRDLLNFLTTLTKTTSRIFCTSRSNVVTEAKDVVGSLGLETIEISAHEADIRLYLEEHISRDRHKGAMDEQLQEAITRKLTSHKL